MTVSASRRTALHILSDIRRRGAFSRPVIDTALGKAGLSREDSAFASRLVYAVISAEGTLDEIIDGSAKRPGAVEPRVRDALRLSIAELLYLRTPSRAAVHQGVDAVRDIRPAAAGFANAVLRQVAERAESFPWGDPATDRDALERASAMPRWLVDRFLEDLGEQAGREALLASIEPAPLYVRVNPFMATTDQATERLTSDGAAPEVCPPDGAALRCRVPHQAVNGSAIRDGLVVVSDAAAQVAPLVCPVGPEKQVLDVGAGRGTKTAILQGLALLSGGPSELTAVDIHAFKLQTLVQSLTALGVPPVHTAVLDATDANALMALGDFDTVLIDAPCSGLGTLRRHPEKRWRVTPEDIDRIAALQLALLEAASSVVRPGGLVVYSTCTITRAENFDVVSAFLAGERGHAFSVRPIGDIADPDWNAFFTPEGYFRSWPRPGDADGHFVAVLARTGR